MALFHICQEALANIAKHAKARHVDVTVWTTAERALLEVRDDGRGFDSEKVKLNIGHGLSNMETRAINAGGEVDISSEPGNGTTVLAWVPFPEPELPGLIVCPESCQAPPLDYNPHMSWDLLGHAWAEKLLQKHIATGEVRHAYLFTGAPGIGRRSLALAFARAINCTQPPSPGEYCGMSRLQAN